MRLNLIGSTLPSINSTKTGIYQQKIQKDLRTMNFNREESSEKSMDFNDLLVENILGNFYIFKNLLGDFRAP